MAGVETRSVLGSDSLPYNVGILNNQMYGILSHRNFDPDEIPWKPEEKVYKWGAVGLHQEMVDFLDYISPTVEEQFVREVVVAKVKEVVFGLWTDCKVDVFGSFKTGLYLPTSDIDMVIFGEWDALPLHTLEQALSKSGISSDIKVLDRATVPIVKMTDRETLLRVDISFNMKNSVKAAELIMSYMETYPCLSYLVFVLKQYLHQRGLNEVWTGGLSSYALILMCVSFLQHTIRPGIPVDKTNLGILLVEFFELYGRLFNYQNTAIRVTNGGYYVRKEVVQQNMDKNFRPSFFCIEDPLCPGNDVGRRSYCAFQVKQSFEYAYTVLSSAVLPHYRFIRSGNDMTILGRIIIVHKKSVEFRKNIMKYAKRLRRSLLHNGFPSSPDSRVLHRASAWGLESDDSNNSNNQKNNSSSRSSSAPQGNRGGRLVNQPTPAPPSRESRTPLVWSTSSQGSTFPPRKNSRDVYLPDENAGRLFSGRGASRDRKTPSSDSCGDGDNGVEKQNQQQWVQVISSDSSEDNVEERREKLKSNNNMDNERIVDRKPRGEYSILADELASLTTVNHQEMERHTSTNTTIPTVNNSNNKNQDSFKSRSSRKSRRQGRKRRCLRELCTESSSQSNMMHSSTTTTHIQDDHQPQTIKACRSMQEEETTRTTSAMTAPLEHGTNPRHPPHNHHYDHNHNGRNNFTRPFGQKKTPANNRVTSSSGTQAVVKSARSNESIASNRSTSYSRSPQAHKRHAASDTTTSSSRWSTQSK